MAQADTQERPRKTLLDHLKALLGAFLIVGGTFLLIELALRVVDPWGIAYFDDLAYMGNEVFATHPQRGFYMPDDTYSFSHWQATIADERRIVPDTDTDAACDIAVLGDSVAFGYGVSDQAAWVNQVAEAMPQTHILNYAVPRYNSTNVLQTYETIEAENPADAYLYLIVQNDIETAINPATQYFAGSGQGLPQILRYTNFAIYRGTSAPVLLQGSGDDTASTEAPLPDSPQLTRFFVELERMAQAPNLTLAAFQQERLTNNMAQRDYELVLLDYPPHRISFADYHLNAVGNEELAVQLLPVFEQLRDTHCNT